MAFEGKVVASAEAAEAALRLFEALDPNERLELASAALASEPHRGLCRKLALKLHSTFRVRSSSSPKRVAVEAQARLEEKGLLGPARRHMRRPTGLGAALVVAALRTAGFGRAIEGSEEVKFLGPDVRLWALYGLDWDAVMALFRVALLGDVAVDPSRWSVLMSRAGGGLPVLVVEELLSYRHLGVEPGALPEALRREVVDVMTTNLWNLDRFAPGVLAELEPLAASLSAGPRADALARLYFWQGRLDELEALDTSSSTEDAPIWVAASALLRRRADAFKALKSATRKLHSSAKPLRRAPLPVRLLCAGTLLGEGDGAALAQALDVLERARKHDQVPPSAERLRRYIAGRLGTPVEGKALTSPRSGLDLDLVVLACVGAYDGLPLREDVAASLRALVADPHDRSAWLRAEAAGVLGGTSEPEAQALAWLERTGARLSLAGAVEPVPEWSRQLEAIGHAVASGAARASGPERAERLVWWAAELGRSNGRWDFTPRLQKRTKSGWTSGRDVALRRLTTEQSEPQPWFTEHDRLVVARAAIAEPHSHTQHAWRLDPVLAASALVGHPLVFLSSAPSQRLEVVEGQIELHTNKHKGGVQLTLEPWCGDSQALLVREGAHRLRVYPVPPEVAQLARLIGPKGLWVPREGLPQLEALTPRLTAVVPVQSSAPQAARDLPPGDPRPHLLLTPIGGGLSVELKVRPLGEGTPAYAPGDGGRAVMARVGDEIASAARDLAKERALSAAAAESLGLPDPELAEEASWAWLIADPIDALELLTAAAGLGDAAVVEWPQGGKIAPPRAVDRAQVRVKIRSRGDWFDVEGEVQVDEDLAISLAELLRLSAERRRGRFIALDTGQVLALTEALRRQLEELAALAEIEKEAVRFPRLAALAVEPSLDGLGQVKADKAWREWLERLRALSSLQPLVPATFRSVLRPYQEEGFTWMARLAEGGLGACLADDMGLGKTVQALALLTHRAADGPALVVAPTSVAANWITEAVRFAPQLRPRLFGDGDRQAAIDDAGPFDLLVTTYGLLLSEAERFASRTWSTVVLDEAQSIKNADAKRTKAAFGLQAGFRLATTGTPVENRLDELWSLFRFLLPGLLGARERFDRRFATPIEAQRDPHARRALKALVSPFVLRRTKAQVLPDLPAKTEIVVPVVLSETEQALYEALRRQALGALQGGSATQAAAGPQHLQVLAELMRLRRACCHPRLVVPEYAGPSAKATAFLEIVDELRRAEHRALVFSQFVDHLSEVRTLLDERGIAYQYLDGSTPAKRRQQAVQAFQAGEGELFLISLRAGGTGLNLTAADYVVHLDPWWNPAVEDQATDRAHRIGQTRPVTVYRLVTQGTVEQKILDLHHQKRDLAASLLDGTDDPTRLDLDALLALLA